MASADSSPSSIAEDPGASGALDLGEHGHVRDVVGALRSPVERVPRPRPGVDDTLRPAARPTRSPTIRSRRTGSAPATSRSCSRRTARSRNSPLREVLPVLLVGVDPADDPVVGRLLISVRFSCGSSPSTVSPPSPSVIGDGDRAVPDTTRSDAISRQTPHRVPASPRHRGRRRNRHRRTRTPTASAPRNDRAHCTAPGR